MNKGQVSLEILLSFTVILLTLIMVYTITSVRNSQTLVFQQSYDASNQCNMVGFAISNVYSNGRGAKMMFEINKDLFIGDSNITVYNDGEVIAYCEFPAKAEPSQLNAGLVEAKNLTGTVVLSNA